MTRNTIIIIIFAFLTLGLAGVYVLNSIETNHIEVDTIKQSPSPMTSPEPVVDDNGLKQYLDKDAGFLIKYDPTFKIREESENGIDLVILGPTQSEGTEIYDGVIFSAQKVKLEDAITFDNFVQMQIEIFQNVGSILEPLSVVEISGLTAKTFKGSGLGEFTLIFIPVNDYSLIAISYLVSDPGNLDFQAKVDQILSYFALID